MTNIIFVTLPAWSPGRQRAQARPVRRLAQRNALAFDSLLIEGALISPAQLAHIAAGEAEQQAPADYGVRRGLALRDEIPLAYRVGQTLFAELTAAPTPSASATVAFTQALLRDVFGFADLAPHPGVTFAAGRGRVPVVVTAPGTGLDRPDPALTTAAGRRMSAALALQDHLNAADNALWGLACNGERLRLLRDNPSLTRPAYIEADLRRIFEADSLADFAALWMLIHATRFAALARHRERRQAAVFWNAGGKRGQKAGEAARDRLRIGVQAALEHLGDGLLRHPGNDTLRDRLRSGALPLPDFFNQLLRLVYRMIFLLAAEDRGLLQAPARAGGAAR